MQLGVTMPDGVLLDTSFFLRFLNEKDALFEKADKYYKNFLEKRITLFISTISIAEYCVGGSIDQLPLKNIIVLPFNIIHAQKSGEYARILYENRQKGQIIVNERSIIINDAKLFAQADSEAQINYFATSDTRSLSLFNSIKNKTNLNFNIIDINNDYTESFGLLNL